MTAERKRWEEMSGRYVAEVEAALAGVDHPRKGEVLADLREHLAEKYSSLPENERTDESFAHVLEEMGPPAEYADLLVERAAEEPAGMRLRWFLGALVILAIAAVTGFLWLRPAGRSAIRQMLGIDFSAPPFFSRAAFGRIEPGMTKDEVRDLVGYPMWRYSIVDLEGTEFWQYSIVASDHAPSYTHYEVQFSADRQKVTRVKVRGPRSWWGKLWLALSGAVSKNLVPDWIDVHETEIVLVRPDGTKKVLSGNDESTYLIVEDSDGYEEIERAVEATDAMVKRLTGNLPPGSVKVLRIYDGERHAEYAPLVDDYFVSAPPLVTGQAAHYGVVFTKGKAYFLPPVYLWNFADEWREDQRWLVEKLAGKRP